MSKEEGLLLGKVEDTGEGEVRVGNTKGIVVVLSSEEGSVHDTPLETELRIEVVYEGGEC